MEEGERGREEKKDGREEYVALKGKLIIDLHLMKRTNHSAQDHPRGSEHKRKKIATAAHDSLPQSECNAASDSVLPGSADNSGTTSCAMEGHPDSTPSPGLSSPQQKQTPNGRANSLLGEPKS